MAINKGPIQVEKTSGNETSVVLLVHPDEVRIEGWCWSIKKRKVTMNKEEFQEVVQAVNELMGWSND